MFAKRAEEADTVRVVSLQLAAFVDYNRIHGAHFCGKFIKLVQMLDNSDLVGFGNAKSREIHVPDSRNNGRKRLLGGFNREIFIIQTAGTECRILHKRG